MDNEELEELYESKTEKIRWKVKNVSTGRTRKLHVDHYLKNHQKNWYISKSFKVPSTFIYKLARDLAKCEDKGCPICHDDLE